MAAQPHLSEEDRQLLATGLNGQDTQAVQVGQQLLGAAIACVWEGAACMIATG
jgi:hypothetical protein